MSRAASTSPLSTLRSMAADIKIAHSVFAIPFAMLAAFMAAAGVPPAIDWSRFGGQLVLVVLAMIGARTVAMLANRLLDRDIDLRNPRTAGRALPSGRVPVRSVVLLLVLVAGCFLAICAAFGLLYGNWWPAWLGVPVLAWISVYPLFKRFTSLCHVYLGSSLALSPLAAALAVEPAALTTQPALWLLGSMVLGWVAGFDVIYALQDIESDRADGLFSLPSRLGPAAALWIAKGLHVLAAASLIAAATLDTRLSTAFWIAVAIVIGLLVWEHATVARWGTSRIALAFFTLNGVISCLLGVVGVIDVLN